MLFPLRNTLSRIFNKTTGKFYFYNITASALLSIFSLNDITCIKPSNNSAIICCGLSSTIEEASETIKGIGKFFDSVKTIFTFISSFIDTDALILLIIVALLSTALSFLGIQKGKFSFFVSLLVADMFWFTWIQSFYQSKEMANKIFILIKSNILLIIPFIVIYFFKSDTFSKKLKPKIIFILKSSFKKKKALSFKEDEIIKLTENLNMSNALLQKTITKDILNRKSKEDITFSDETLNQINAMKEILAKIKEN